MSGKTIGQIALTVAVVLLFVAYGAHRGTL